MPAVGWQGETGTARRRTVGAVRRTRTYIAPGTSAYVQATSAEPDTGLEGSVFYGADTGVRYGSNNGKAGKHVVCRADQDVGRSAVMSITDDFIAAVDCAAAFSSPTPSSAPAAAKSRAATAPPFLFSTSSVDVARRGPGSPAFIDWTHLQGSSHSSAFRCQTWSLDDGLLHRGVAKARSVRDN